MEVVIKSKTSDRPLEDRSVDDIHKRRKQLEEELKPSLFSHDQMMQRDCKDRDAEEKRLRDYVERQKINEPKMAEWNRLNRELKRRGKEGKPMSIDALRKRGNVKHD